MLREWIELAIEDESMKGLDELTDLFMNTIRPSQLCQLMIYISLTNNLEDFSNSIRLMCASRTTMPTRIEDTGEA